MRTIHYFEFETHVLLKGKRLPAKVEAILSAGPTEVREIEGVKIKLLDTGVTVVVSNQQMRDIRMEILEKCKA